MRRLGLLICVISAVACGDDPAPASNTSTNNTSTNNTSTNNTSENNTSENNTATNNTSTNNTSVNNTSLNNTQCVGLSPAIGECDPLCQSGCDAQEACVARQGAEAFEATCQEGTGVLGQDEPCVNDADCVAGAMCLGLDGGATTCRLYCRTGGEEQPQCPTGYQCRPFQLESRVGVCDIPLNECSYFPNSCEDGKECYDTPNGTRCSSFNEEATPDQACTQSTECNDRYRCAGTSPQTLTCKPICNPDEEVNTCDEGLNCVQMRDASGNLLLWGACM